MSAIAAAITTQQAGQVPVPVNAAIKRPADDVAGGGNPPKKKRGRPKGSATRPACPAVSAALAASEAGGKAMKRTSHDHPHPRCRPSPALPLYASPRPPRSRSGPRCGRRCAYESFMRCTRFTARKEFSASNAGAEHIRPPPHPLNISLRSRPLRHARPLLPRPEPLPPASSPPAPCASLLSFPQSI